MPPVGYAVIYCNSTDCHTWYKLLSDLDIFLQDSHVLPHASHMISIRSNPDVNKPCTTHRSMILLLVDELRVDQLASDEISSTSCVNCALVSNGRNLARDEDRVPPEDESRFGTLIDTNKNWLYWTDTPDRQTHSIQLLCLLTTTLFLHAQNWRKPSNLNESCKTQVHSAHACSRIIPK